MPNDATISITPNLEVEIRGPDGTQRIKLSRISAQAFGAALRLVSGVPSKGATANARVFNVVLGESVGLATKAPRTVRLGDSPGRRGHVVRLRP